MKYLHTMFRVSDVNQSLDFFCKNLGLTETRRKDNEAGRYTLIFLAADESPEAEIELTYNWDPEEYTGGRNFGHLAFAVARPATAAWPSFVRRTESPSSFCKRETPWSRKSPGPPWKAPANGRERVIGA